MKRGKVFCFAMATAMMFSIPACAAPSTNVSESSSAESRYESVKDEWKERPEGEKPEGMMGFDVDDLVEAGIIDSEQAEKIQTYLQENQPERAEQSEEGKEKPEEGEKLEKPQLMEEKDFEKMKNSVDLPERPETIPEEGSENMQKKSPEISEERSNPILTKLVEEEILTQEQADAIQEYWKENQKQERPEMPIEGTDSEAE